MKTFQGLGVSHNHALGLAFKFNNGCQLIEQKQDSVQVFLDKFTEIRMQAISEINQLYYEALKSEPEEADIFLSHELLLKDNYLIESVSNNIKAGMCLVESLSKSMQELINVFEVMDNETFNSKTNDIEDVFQRLIDIAKGTKLPTIIPEQDFILCCENLLPSYLYRFNNKHLKGIVVKNGSYSSHGVILAKSKNIPLIINVNEFEEIQNNDQILISGNTGKIVFIKRN